MVKLNFNRLGRASTLLPFVRLILHSFDLPINVSYRFYAANDHRLTLFLQVTLKEIYRCNFNYPETK